jgi:ABC-2 type transport system ATP-binding protein
VQSPTEPERTGTQPAEPELAVEAHQLGKRFGDLWALRGLDLAVAPGTVCGLLGPNGAGKTTAVRILTTLLTPTEGSATVAGHDVVGHAGKVRTRIGLAGQQSAVDELLTGRSNLELVGRLYHLGARRARQRADALLEQFSLTDAADRLTKTYSGGMRRRLDLAASLVASPPVLFLDEPTTGLDPHSRNELWLVLHDLVRDGTTLVLTTQYLEEADRLCDDIVVIDHGRMVAHGSPDELKVAVGGSLIDVTLYDADAIEPAARVLARLTGTEPQIDVLDRRVSAAVTSADLGLAAVVRALDDAGVAVDDVGRRRPTLDDVFLTLTGHPAEDDAEGADDDDTSSTPADAPSATERLQETLA